jgi:hypothetical protein
VQQRLEVVCQRHKVVHAVQLLQQLAQRLQEPHVLSGLVPRCLHILQATNKTCITCRVDMHALKVVSELDQGCSCFIETSQLSADRKHTAVPADSTTDFAMRTWNRRWKA